MKKDFPRYCCWCGKQENQEKECKLYSNKNSKKLKQLVDRTK